VQLRHLLLERAEKRSIRIEISSGGRRQFSLENANSVRYSMSRSMQARMIARTASTPRRWPATRGSMRCFRPAAVAVHDDGDVPRHGGRRRDIARGARKHEKACLGFEVEWRGVARCGKP
jgi:hypothetical protein